MNNYGHTNTLSDYRMNCLYSPIDWREAVIEDLNTSPESSSCFADDDCVLGEESLYRLNFEEADDVVLNYFIEQNTFIIQRKTITEQIISFADLKNNWDGFGALPTGIKCAISAISILENLSNLAIIMMDDILPNTNGSLLMEWINRSNEKFSLSIGADYFSFYFEENKTPHFYNKLKCNNTGDINELNRMIRKFLQ